MTTIAWDGTTLAADQASWSGNARRRVHKIHRLDDGIFAGCGSGAFVEAYVAWRRGERAQPDPTLYDVEKSHSVGVFIRNDRTVWVVTDRCELIPMDEERYAAGAGQDFAWGALEAGATAREAIEITMRRSDMAGIGIDEMRLDEAVAEVVMLSDPPRNWRTERGL